MRFVRGHVPQKRGAQVWNWAGGRKHTDGYIEIKMPDHPRANRAGYVREHSITAERALGKPLPLGAEVHHVDLNRANNAHDNLVVCPNRAYHMLLHQRLRALEACGDANALRCKICHRYDNQRDIMPVSRKVSSYAHRACHRASRKAPLRPTPPRLSDDGVHAIRDAART